MQNNLSTSPISCIACQSTDNTVIGIGNNERQIHRCHNCQLIFAYPYLTGDFSKSDFVQHQTSPTSGGNAQARRPSMQFMAQELQKYQPQAGRLLDIGCSQGTFFDLIDAEKPKAWDFYGVEPILRFNYKNARVLHQPLRDCGFEANFFDAVSLLDTLYILPEPDKDLHEIRRIIKTDGILLFDIPGQAYLRLRGKIGSLLHLQHTQTFAAYSFYFSQKSLELLLEQAGFQIIACLLERGLSHENQVLQTFMKTYTGTIRSLNHWFKLSPEYSPKLIYFAKPI